MIEKKIEILRVIHLAKIDPASRRKYPIDLFGQVSNLKRQFTE
jgi:hypothetical protein